MATDHFRIRNGDVELLLTVDGSGPDLLFVHGLGSASEMWDRWVAVLAPTHRCWRLDLRGHGESDPATNYWPSAYAADVAAALDHIGEPTVGVGHSLGGRSIADVAAVSHPLLAASYIIDSTFVRDPEILAARPTSSTAGIFARILKMIEQYRAEGRPVDDYEQWLGDAPYPGGGLIREAFSPASLRGRAASLAVVDPAAIMATLNGFSEEPGIEIAVSTPMRIAAADHRLGGGISPAAEAAILRAVPHAQIRRFDGVGHPMLMVQDFDAAILADLQGFLQDHHC